MEWKAPLNINPEQTLGFRPGKVEGLIFLFLYTIIPIFHFSIIP
jgi:hypothetical protein